MHDTGCDEIYVVVTDLRRKEMDDVTEYFKLVSRFGFGRRCKPSMEDRIQREREIDTAMTRIPPTINFIFWLLDIRLSHELLRQHRSPCFPQIDLIVRAILYEKRPRFLVLFSRQTTSYSQIFFTDPSYIPDQEIFYDYPTGCPNPCCTDDCEMIRFPRRGNGSASILQIKTSGKRKRVKSRFMCNWIDCDISFGEISTPRISANKSCDGSELSIESSAFEPTRNSGQLCSKCKLVKYCSPEHQRKDWDNHKRMCVKS